METYKCKYKITNLISKNTLNKVGIMHLINNSNNPFEIQIRQPERSIEVDDKYLSTISVDKQFI